MLFGGPRLAHGPVLAGAVRSRHDGGSRPSSLTPRGDPRRTQAMEHWAAPEAWWRRHTSRDPSPPALSHSDALADALADDLAAAAAPAEPLTAFGGIF